MNGTSSTAPAAGGLPESRTAPPLPRVPLWLGWPLAHVLPLAGLPPVLFALRHRLAPPSITTAGFPGTLAALSLGQGLALHGRIDRPFLWTLATTAGFTLAEAVGMPLASLLAGLGIHDFAVIAAAHATGAGLVAACQARVLRVNGGRLRRWVAVNGAAAGVFAALAAPFWADAWLPGHLPGEPPGARGLTTLLRVAAATGLATLPALERLLGGLETRGA